MPNPASEDFNKQIMAEFHANQGKVGGPFAGADILILTSTGARTGQTRWNPLVYTRDGDRFVIVASKGGAPASPDWYHNLVANPSAVIEVGTDVISVEASIARGAERDRLYAGHAAKMPQFLEYAKKTNRTIPVIVLTRKR
ncbi:MAG: nitroreductase family deazaflavin-dependent oxidoreductase [Dehalococcoidia bacterium]